MPIICVTDRTSTHKWLRCRIWVRWRDQWRVVHILASSKACAQKKTLPTWFLDVENQRDAPKPHILRTLTLQGLFGRNGNVSWLLLVHYGMEILPGDSSGFKQLLPNMAEPLAFARRNLVVQLGQRFLAAPETYKH